MKFIINESDREAASILAMVADAVLNHRYSFEITHGDDKRYAPTQIKLFVGAALQERKCALGARKK